VPTSKETDITNPDLTSSKSATFSCLGLGVMGAKCTVGVKMSVFNNQG
jgi:hypothetical protein